MVANSYIILFAYTKWSGYRKWGYMSQLWWCSLSVWTCTAAVLSSPPEAVHRLMITGTIACNKHSYVCHWKRRHSPDTRLCSSMHIRRNCCSYYYELFTDWFHFDNQTEMPKYYRLKRWITTLGANLKQIFKPFMSFPGCCQLSSIYASFESMRRNFYISFCPFF